VGEARVLVSMVEGNFPAALLRVLPRGPLDHEVLLLMTGHPPVSDFGLLRFASASSLFLLVR